MSVALGLFFALELTRAVLTEGMYTGSNSSNDDSGATRTPLLHPQATILAVEAVRVGVTMLICAITLPNPASRLFRLDRFGGVAVQAMLWIASVATVSILMQLRLPITGILHHMLVQKQRSARAWIALFVIYCGVVISQLPKKGTAFSFTDARAVAMSLVLSTVSGIASIVSETNMKSGRLAGLSFWEQQYRVSLMGVVSGAIFLMALATFGDEDVVDARGGGGGSWSLGGLVLVNVHRATGFSIAMTTGSVFAAAGSGLFTGLVVRQLDSVVKLIAQALAAVFTTAVVYLAFGTFKGDAEYFGFGSILLIVGAAWYALETSNNAKHLQFKRKFYRMLTVGRYGEGEEGGKKEK
ncbi:hypothetical protein HK100_011432 [Physocladia obscura]|uniref:Uncharacterized protein n=1 Tax=Physocladia obscura TaxID=109957 RepID=A0AAD5XGZ1_9FUNG|nr:hypothetical protein HK100_011432 [Physocladia obscura]